MIYLYIQIINQEVGKRTKIFCIEPITTVGNWGPNYAFKETEWGIMTQQMCNNSLHDAMSSNEQRCVHTRAVPLVACKLIARIA